MRIAALYDVHANLLALEAVLEDIRRADIDHIVIGGDVLPGPMPNETLACLLSLDMPKKFICGNGEVAVLDYMAGKKPSVPAQYLPVIAWTAEQLHSDDQKRLTEWPKTVSAQINGLGDVLFCHATPRNENEIFTRLTTEDRVLPVFAGVNASLVVCGHTHMQFDRVVGDIRVLNAGSVGMPFGKTGADWLLLGPDVQLRHTDYDLTKAADGIRATNYPQAEKFAERYILKPPSEQEMLELYAGAELR
jgi:predicted phosphodiesterase